MSIRLEKSKAARLDEAARRMETALGRADEDAERFMRIFYEGVAPEEFFEWTPESLHGAALSLWHFFSRRQAGRPKIRLYNPNELEHGWKSSHTVVEIVNDDMPFLVDSVKAALNGQGLTLHLLIHPIFRVRRDSRGKLIELVGPARVTDKGEAESILHFQVSQQADSRVLEAVRTVLERVLADVRAAVEDWQPMLHKLDSIIEDLENDPPPLCEGSISEGIDFLKWLRNHNFTFLGFREYELEQEKDGDHLSIVPDSGLGILRNVTPEAEARHRTPLPSELARFARQPELLILTKASSRATVHRPVYMDYIGVRLFDESGKVRGEKRFLGLLTSSAYNRSPSEIPLLKQKIRRIMDRTGYRPNSHNAKIMLNILETYPRDELFQTDDDQLYEICRGILHLSERQRIRLFVRRDNYARFFSCLVFVPRDQYDTSLREKYMAILMEELDGESVDFTTYISDAPMARVHFIVRTKGEAPRIDVEEVETRLVKASRQWSDDLLVALNEAFDESRAYELYHVYREAFSPGYQENFPARVAVSDIRLLEQVRRAGSIAVSLYRRPAACAESVNFKIFSAGTPLPLSDALPLIEHMGLRVVTETPYSVRADNSGQSVYIHDFEAASEGMQIHLEAIRDNFQDTFVRVWSGQLESDGLNALVLKAGLNWRAITVLRTYMKYLRQAQFPFSEAYIQETLDRHYAIAALLVELFLVRFNPDYKKDSRNRVRGLEKRISEALDLVDSLDEDRILRKFLELIRATLRTNYFQTGADHEPKEYLSVKLNSRIIEGLPQPRPMVEIFVYSARMEAVHLRGGKVARGGIRWSDRKEDFRTEILGLMKAQMVKNAVIVPVGSKGGFIVKRPPAEGGRDALLAEVIESYKTMIRALLDLTDNLKGGEVVSPPALRRYDEDDPYLVVAADKGTATFSDIANSVAREYGFWLDDAFASGGSSGYDHKKMGITARGAWESVKRHFRELELDPEEDDFSVVGIGDMSGDVFGNGMLQSGHIRLIAAFNHLHIFLDPFPDVERSLQERRRLFELSRSSWSDYNPELISKGGGVFERKAKSIPLSAEVRKRLEIKEEKLPPNELIRRILKAKIDLLWFGGIGTYVKSSQESHSEVGDRSNDSLRVNASELRCRVIAEGANLGVTQRGRIEFALAGGKINTDFIDNSAGVDCSDHEVNIKIALGEVVSAGHLRLQQRDALLQKMTGEVADLVLRDNFLQAQALSIMESQGPLLLEQQGRFIRRLEREGKLNRTIEFLPDDEVLAERRADRQGLTRPEIAILLAYSKITLFDELLDSDLPEDPLIAEDLLCYFPHPLRTAFRKALDRHRLRREIISTYVANSLVNRVGATFVDELAEKTRLFPSHIARAYAVTRNVFDLPAVWGEIEKLAKNVPTGVQMDLFLQVARLTRRATLWFLQNRKQPMDVAQTAAEFGPGVAALRSCGLEILAPSDRKSMERRIKGISDKGVPPALAEKVVTLEVLASACDIVKIARSLDFSEREVGEIYFTVGARFGFDWVRNAAHRVAAQSHWQQMALSNLVDESYLVQRQLTTQVMDRTKGRRPKEGFVEAWAAGRPGLIRGTDKLLEELRTTRPVDLSMLLVANFQFRNLVRNE